MSLDMPPHTPRQLEQSWLLQPLAPLERARLLGRLPQRKYADGQMIFGQGDQGSSLMLVVEGRVRIGTMSREGRELILAIVETGELFGELALLDGKERSADAVAFGNCVVVALDRRDLLPLLREWPDTAMRLLEFVCGRVRTANDRLEGVVFLTVEARLARLLLSPDRRALDRAGRASSRELSQSDLARLIGASRQTVNQLLSRWLADGTVIRVGRALLVRDATRLANLTEAGKTRN